MIKSSKRIGILAAIICLTSACVEPYDPPLGNTDVNHLVVNGFLNTSDGAAIINLTRTLPVKSSEEIPRVTGATVYIEDDKGSVYSLYETIPGSYQGPVISSGADTRYRLGIRLSTNREYFSDFVDFVETPPIDSITYSAKRDGVQFAVNTHDHSGLLRYFRWRYIETFEYHSQFNSSYMFSMDEIVPRPYDQAINTCWKTNMSTEILVASTQQLDASIISSAPITFIPKGSMKLSVKYSLLVRQQALTQEEYNYWLELGKTTEQVGGLFDPLPVEVAGNMHCATDPNEKVLGFFSGGTIMEARRSVRLGELPREVRSFYRNSLGCAIDTILLEDLPDISRSTLLINELVSISGGLIGYSTSGLSCIDCTTFGGTTRKPLFWE